MVHPILGFSYSILRHLTEDKSKSKNLRTVEPVVPKRDKTQEIADLKAILNQKEIYPKA